MIHKGSEKGSEYLRIMNPWEFQELVRKSRRGQGDVGKDTHARAHPSDLQTGSCTVGQGSLVELPEGMSECRAFERQKHTSSKEALKFWGIWEE